MSKKSNSNLRNAKKNKNDEFFTQLSDIEKELKHYKAHFKGKTVYCNCDDARESNFFKYFFLNFKELGLKKLICTGYKEGGKGVLLTTECGDVDEDGIIGNNELNTTEMNGDGDFRSDECIELLKESDIVVTNPPFSLFREFITLLFEYGKKFLIIGNQNAITYKEIFPLIRENKLWLGYGFKGGATHFINTKYEDYAKGGEHKEGMIRVSGVVWFTNLPHSKRNEELILVEKYSADKYPKYDNYDAINVDKTKDIPMDYEGVMGVPITFLDKYCPEQFEIIGGFNGYKECDYENSLLCGDVTEYYDKNNILKNWTGPTVNKHPKYYRILIRNRKPRNNY